MRWQLSPGGLVTVAAAAGMLLLAVAVWRRHRVAEGAWLGLALSATALWAAAYSLELAATTSSTRQMWGDLKYVGICALPPAWVMFVSKYTGGGRWLSRRGVMLLLLVEPVLVLALLANNGTHHLIRYYPRGADVARTGALFWPHGVYTYALLWGATAVLIVRLSRLSPVYRWQSTVLLVSVLVPFICNVLYNTGVPPLDTLDLTPFAFLGTGVVLVWGVLRARLVGLRPLGRSQAFMRVSDPIVTVDPLARVLDINAAATAMLRKPSCDVIGRNIAALLPSAPRLLARPIGEHTVEEVIGDRVYELRASPVTDRRSRLLATLLLAHDITERKAAEQQLTHRALHDPLTGAANRTLFFERLNHALDHSTRTGQRVAVLYLDIDSFKMINDRLGHAIGDQVLLEVAHRLQTTLRKDDTVARMGGDEFAILLEEVSTDRDPEQVAAHINASLLAPMLVDEHPLTITASVGLATGANVAADELVRRADERMYGIKRERLRRIDLNPTATFPSVTDVN